MSIERAREHFKKFGVEDKIMEFDTPISTVDLAAKALGVNNEDIGKSLSFMVDDMPIIIVVKGDARVDNKKFKEEFNTKAKMIKYELVEEMTGHAAGGVCPFGVRENVKVYLDVSLKTLERVYPACGSSNSGIELRIDELEKYSNYLKWVDITKNKK